MTKLIVLKQDRGPKENKDHVHNYSTERFVNRKDIEFSKCKRCGWKVYPDNAVQIFGGTHTEILWPND